MMDLATEPEELTPTQAIRCAARHLATLAEGLSRHRVIYDSRALRVEASEAIEEAANALAELAVDHADAFRIVASMVLYGVRAAPDMRGDADWLARLADAIEAEESRAA